MTCHTTSIQIECPFGYKIVSPELCHYRQYISQLIEDPIQHPYCQNSCKVELSEIIPEQNWYVCDGCGMLLVLVNFKDCPVCGEIVVGEDENA